jgi:hypothetical protein
MKTLIESIIGRKNTQSRRIWYNSESKLSKDEIIGDIEDCISNIQNNNHYLHRIDDPDSPVEYVVDVLNIAARCKDKKISDLAKKYLLRTSDKDLFNGIIAISQLLGI